MKKIFQTASILLMVVFLAACSATPTPQADQANNPPAQGDQAQGQNGGPRNTLESKLAMGTLKLEGTSQAVTADEAKTLLPLWQQVKTISANNPPSQTDLQAVYQQIEKGMTADQIQTITNMTLSQTDMQDLMKSLGIQITPGAGRPGGNNGTPFPTMDANQRTTRTAQRTLTPGNGGGGAGRGGFGGGFGFSRIFIDPLIQVLQKRAGG